MTDSSWRKSYVVYLVVTAPFIVLSMLFVHARWLQAAITFAIVLAGLKVKGPLQRRIWP